MLRFMLDSILPQLARSPYSTELVIVDDGSNDETPVLLQQIQRDSPVPVIVLHGPKQGVAAARNLAVEHARGTWLASCDDDQIACPGWFDSLRSATDATGAAFVGGSMELHLPQGFAVENYGPRAQRLLGASPPTGEIREYDAGCYPATNNVLMLASAVVALGGFDPAFTQGGEDSDLFLRAKQAGYALWFEPKAKMRHMLTPRRLTPQGLRWTSLRIGSGDLRMEQRKRSVVGPLKRATVRIAILGRDIVQFAAAKMRRSRPAALDAQCSMWYTQGVLRALPAILLGRAGMRSAFLNQMDFRRRNGERTA